MFGMVYFHLPDLWNARGKSRDRVSLAQGPKYVEDDVESITTSGLMTQKTIFVDNLLDAGAFSLLSPTDFSTMLTLSSAFLVLELCLEALRSGV